MPAKQSSTAETPVQQQQTQTQNQQQQQTLAIGRIVHFVTTDGSERAAMVTWVYHEGNERPGEVDLAVFTTAVEHGSQGAVYGYGNASYDAGGTTPNTWHWPAEGTPHPESSTLSAATAQVTGEAQAAETAANPTATPPSAPSSSGAGGQQS